MEFAGDMSAITTLVPQWIMDSETQAVILCGLTCVGAWVILTWLIQVLKYLFPCQCDN